MFEKEAEEKNDRKRKITKIMKCNETEVRYMTEREKNGERLALRISRHRQAKHESLKDEDVKTAYIKGCADTAQEMTWKYEKQKEINKELVDENGKLLQRIAQLEKDVTENESDCSMCDFPKLKQDLEKENTELKEQTEEMKNKCSTLLDKLYLSGLKPNQIALVERMQDILGV